MAKIQFSNPLIQSVSGKMGNIVFRRSQRGGYYVAKAPDLSHVKPSEAQLAQRQRFKEATLYAKAALADPQVAEHYRQAALSLPGKTPYNLALSDYFKGINLLTQSQPLP